MSTRSRQIELASRPTGPPNRDNFRLATITVQDPGPGEILVRNLVMSLDPGMRPRMNDLKSYLPPYDVGKPLDGEAIGEVVSSTVDSLRPGTIVLHRLGWREYATVAANAVTRLDTTVAPINTYLGVLGTVGLTAYVGLLKTAEFQTGDTVWVSAAAGAVGQIVGQLAKIRGANRVIGSTGSATKVAYLTEQLGFDVAFNYRDGSVAEQLAAAAPNGIDVYFDNVGGDHLEAAIASANVHARFAICGAISAYNRTDPLPSPRNLPLIVGKRLQLRGILVLDHADLREAFFSEMIPLVASGRLRGQETVVEGLERAPEAFVGMFRGDGIGKTLVALST